MDKFALSTGLIGLAIGLVALLVLVYLISRLAKRKARAGRAFNLLLNSAVLAVLSAAFIFLSLFVQTLNRYLHDQRIGTITARQEGQALVMEFADLKTERQFDFELNGDQWMIEGYIVRWNPLLRWLGAGAYYKIDRFSGRYESDTCSLRPGRYSIDDSHRGLWRYLLKHGNKLRVIDAAYGIAAFQYPGSEPYGLYINDSGFIIKKD
ncbi:MAG: hypothetical protein KJ620_03380 [Candidatus Edwardsbacteria bacterium]|nr:hypothetical protein [Candidatus Edwardsbacteria bacterium]MBU1577142.1 hypothetical protein [Candidatus Edwardsbacteria bacterium]MBU2463780.1 hypothetical protein [Candidatus Edwardsbacteria bacterium]MBU2593762.1 hypothetical protein [Candidatus Edwardsbacteria bacterium]